MRLSFIVAVGLCMGLTLEAMTFEEYQASEMKAFKAYKDAMDKEFMDYLNQPWKPFKSEKSAPKMRPKPTVIEPVEKLPKKQIAVEVPKVEKEVPVTVIETIKETPPKVVELPKTVVTPHNEKQHKSVVAFYGHEIAFKYDNPLENRYSTTLNQDKLTAAWERFATSEYLELLKQIKETSQALNLNDWGELKLIEKIADKLFRNKNESRLFTWFIFTKNGKDIKIGYERNNVVLMTPMNTGLYNTVYFTIAGKKYYAIDYAYGKTLSSIKTYDQSHPSAKNSFDLRIDKRPNFKSLTATRSLKFTYDNQAITVPLAYDKVYVSYFKDYPQVDFDNYFSAPISPVAERSIKEEIAKLIKGKGEVEAVNIILSLVQHGLTYKIDETQFGHEKVMLPEETLFYPYSDCDDRSVLFAKLIKDLLGLEVVGIEYPQHLATAVALKSTLKGGSSIVKNGTRYYMADPSYVGSKLGMVAPAYKTASFKVIHAQ